jgi:hypothetical protein
LTRAQKRQLQADTNTKQKQSKTSVKRNKKTSGKRFCEFLKQKKKGGYIAGDTRRIGQKVIHRSEISNAQYGCCFSTTAQQSETICALRRRQRNVEHVIVVVVVRPRCVLVIPSDGRASVENFWLRTKNVLFEYAQGFNVVKQYDR